MRVVPITVLSALALSASISASAQKSARGSVIEHTGEVGELIVLRDGIVYWLSVGDDLFQDDILRAQAADSAVITYQGCEMTLPEQEDVQLDDAFCMAAVDVEPSMAVMASEGGTVTGSTVAATGGNAPLIVGGVVLSAGGLAAAINGGSGGTGSAASAAAGAPQASTVSGS